MSRSPSPGVPDVLRRIVERRCERYAGVADSALDERAAPLATAENRFLAALSAMPAGRAALIAEVKMGSPRLGSLVGRVDPVAQARLYAAAEPAAGGAAALSVVVEPDFFHGSYELLAECRQASGLPTIAKDFVVAGRQLEMAAAAGADAILLIAALYPAEELARWARRSRALGLVPLIETHDAADLAKLRPAGKGRAKAVGKSVGKTGGTGDGGWELVGVNNRDLRTFEVDLEHSIACLPDLPSGALRVAESGIHGGADVARLHKAGFDAFLVGESLLLAADPAARLRELVSMRAAR